MDDIQQSLAVVVGRLTGCEATKAPVEPSRARAVLGTAVPNMEANADKRGVITQTEKMELAESYEAVAANCLKAVITLELEQQKLEQNQTPELAPEMAMTM